MRTRPTSILYRRNGERQYSAQVGAPRRDMPRPFNVTLIQPSGYVHSLALKEAAEYVHYMLRICGHQSQLSTNYFSRDACNVIFCAHLLGESYLAKIPRDSIIFNSEQLEDATGWHFSSGVYAEILKRFHVWDYSWANLDKIAHPRKSFIPFLYCRDLLREDLPRWPGRSLLFYGAITERRKRILKALGNAGIPVKVLFDQYGDRRDAEMFASLAVVNLHKTDDTTLFEPIRCFYPLINRIPVISEAVGADQTAEPYRDSVCFLDGGNFVESVVDLHRRANESARELRERALRFETTSAVAAISAAVEGFLETIS